VGHRRRVSAVVDRDELVVRLALEKGAKEGPPDAPEAVDRDARHCRSAARASVSMGVARADLVDTERSSRCV
jgi:hypothetical protein